MLKTIEGLSHTLETLLRQVGQVISVASRLPARALHRDINMDSRIKKWDYQEHGGACLLGVNGNIIIAHGRSQSKAIKNAIGMAIRTAERDIANIIKEDNNAQAD